MEINEITERTIGCAFTVSNVLGASFLEKVYDNALLHELRKTGVRAAQQHPIEVLYDGTVVGEYVAHLLLENRGIVELKATKAIDPIHEAQLLNYLKATGLKLGLLLNFGTPRLGIKRMAL